MISMDWRFDKDLTIADKQGTVVKSSIAEKIVDEMLKLHVKAGILSTEGNGYSYNQDGLLVKSYNDGYSMMIDITKGDLSIHGFHHYTEEELSSDC